MHPAFSRVAHRPWPVPQRAWVGRQSWQDLLFAHWPVAAHVLRPLVPEGLQIDECEGTSWVGVIPFRIAGLMARGVPNLPYISDFPELNLRLYVSRNGKPGVWFLSLDAGNALAVIGARSLFFLPYYWARMQVEAQAQAIAYRSQRRLSGGRAAFRALYQPISPASEPQPGSLEAFLTERYCLYARGPTGTLWRTEVHHHPWPLQKAEAEWIENTIAEPHGLDLKGPPPLLHFSRRLDIVLWAPERA